MQAIYTLLLVTSLTLLFAQLCVTQKRAVHLVFALFCGSMAMVATKQLTADTIGPYQYLIGLGTCATCNAFWLVARGLFRPKSAIELRHLLVAFVIAGLIVASQLLNMADALSGQTGMGSQRFASILAELTNLLSSTILTLTFWEALRGYRATSGAARYQRLLFMLSFGGAVFACTLVARGLLSPQQFDSLFPWFVAVSALQILIVTQSILLWQQRQTRLAERRSNIQQSSDTTHSEPDEQQGSVALLAALQQLLVDQKQYLQANLKLKDLAALLDVPEYRISRLLRNNIGASNFNQYINGLRIEHAKQLLVAPDHKHWTILVIALESGFASVESFNRAFKQRCNMTPGEFRALNQANTAQNKLATA